MRIVLSIVACVIVLLMPLASLSAQENGESAGAEEHEYHKNHSSSFLGATTHLDPNDTGFTIGVEYARRFSRLVAVAVTVEMASSTLERDVILGLPVLVYPWRGLGLTVGPAAELATREEEHGDEVKEVTEVEFLLRFGVGYWFALNETVAVSPAIFADVANGRWSLVYGVLFGVGW